MVRSMVRLISGDQRRQDQRNRRRQRNLMMQERTELAIALQNDGGPASLGHACRGPIHNDLSEKRRARVFLG